MKIVKISKKFALAIILIALVTTASIYAILVLKPPTSHSEQQKTTITVIDGAGRNVTVKVPVERIVSLNDGLTEM
ncbi:MAG: hypothetical protein QXL52_05335, partial [Nitrososphaerales archaeon]